MLEILRVLEALADAHEHQVEAGHNEVMILAMRLFGRCSLAKMSSKMLI